MAVGSLLAYGFQRDNQNSVEQQVNQSKEYIDSIIRNKENQYFEWLIVELKNILRLVESKEREFYNSLNLNDKSYIGLNNKIKEIENEFECMLPDGAIMREVKQKYYFHKIEHATNKELSDAVEQVLNDFLEQKEIEDQLVSKAFEKAAGEKLTDIDFVGQFIQKNLRIDDNGKSGRFVTTRGKDKVGLGKIISTFNPPKKNKKPSVTVSIEGVSISSDFRKKLEKQLTNLYEKYNDTKGKIDAMSIDPAIYRNQINDIIRKYIKGFDQLGLNLTQFDLNRSLASTIGYLGELRATAILNKLAPNGARGTGNLKKAIKKQEIPIDVVCEENGFQIKNYALDENSVTFSNTLSSVSWIKDRLQITGELQEVLIELFGIYQYNQPFTPKEGKEVPGLEQYKSIYNRIADPMTETGLLYDLKPVYDSRIPYMLKLADVFSVDGESLFSSRQLYFNTFFWINKFLVPSSVMLTRLIDQLTNKNNSKMFLTSYEFSSPLHDKERYANLGKKHREKGFISFSPTDMAKKIKTTYNITIDLSDIMKYYS